jgi:hypothetical protein
VAHADEADARKAMKAMSDYLASQKAIAIDFDSNLEIVTTQNQKLALASSGTVTLNRPDKLRATRKGGFADIELAFDGKSLTALRKDTNIFAQVDAPGTIDQLVDTLRDKYHRPVPAADLLMSNPYDQLMPEVVDVKDLGSGFIRGMECDHYAFRTKEVDWQIWIAQGDGGATLDRGMPSGGPLVLQRPNIGSSARHPPQRQALTSSSEGWQLPKAAARRRAP